MKAIGIVRRIDELGRLVLPIELRRSLDISERDPIEISVDGDTIILRKYQPHCVFCGNDKKVVPYMGKNVCSTCLKHLQEL